MRTFATVIPVWWWGAKLDCITSWAGGEVIKKACWLWGTMLTKHSSKCLNGLYVSVIRLLAHCLLFPFCLCVGEPDRKGKAHVSTQFWSRLFAKARPTCRDNWLSYIGVILQYIGKYLTHYSYHTVVTLEFVLLLNFTKEILHVLISFGLSWYCESVK